MIPETYNVDWEALKVDLSARGKSRLLLQFQNSPVFCAVLDAFSAEVQELLDAIVEVGKQRTLYYAKGVNQDAIGQIVGQPRQGWTFEDIGWIDESKTGAILAEDSVQIFAVKEALTTTVTDNDYLDFLLLRIKSNFNRYSSIPDITSSIYDVTGVLAIIQRVGPEQLDILTSSQIPAFTEQLILRKISSEVGDDIFMMPYPATCEVRVVYNKTFSTEDGLWITDETGVSVITENIPNGK